ncbi:hypothetical protein F01_550026 [Burkholderia cenocepacia]|nr:hypothetical protein F01_550026 [Burkholderia cenocepacia]DAG72503.1 MAG TPA: hypothetical protein [Caudoviricetes sp.]
MTDRFYAGGEAGPSLINEKWTFQLSHYKRFRREC